MIEFYTASTPNGRKVAIMLEELGLKYNEHKINLKDLEQKRPEFLAMNPNGKIPTIVDTEGPEGKTTVFESGAILFYLAEKYGKFIGKNLTEKTHAMQWVMFQMSAIGPIFGNYYYGLHTLKPHNPGFIERFEKEALRLLSVMEIQLTDSDYLAGSEYTIADIATYPWIAGFIHGQPKWFEDKKGIKAWAARLADRPAIQKAMV
ncbi:glutathione S-transferase family protein [Bdellovibrio bacteriovorus]|uniref:glutathione S-transferase family protein n=1 Tax=Bdellovibrio bacteriovorus TaxID=959 RepID=UPI0035A5D50C